MSSTACWYLYYVLWYRLSHFLSKSWAVVLGFSFLSSITTVLCCRWYPVRFMRVTCSNHVSAFSSVFLPSPFLVLSLLVVRWSLLKPDHFWCMNYPFVFFSLDTNTQSHVAELVLPYYNKGGFHLDLGRIVGLECNIKILLIDSPGGGRWRGCT